MLLLNEGSDIIIWGCGYRSNWFTKKYKDRYNICYYVDQKVSENEEEEVCIGSKRCMVYNPNYLQNENLDKLSIIIAIDKWKEMIPLLNDKYIKIFDNCFPWEYIEYQSFDPLILKYISSKKGKEKIIRKMVAGRKICLPIGFCHLQAYKQLLIANEKFQKKFIFVDLPAINDEKNEAYGMFQEEWIYKICDILLLGVMPQNLRLGMYGTIKKNIEKWTRSDCRVISITSAAFRGYFPQHAEQRNQGCDENGIPIVRYFAWGDKNINKMYKRGMSPIEITEKILDTEYYDTDMCRSFFENEFEILEEAEEECDVKIADYLRSIYDKSVVYYSWTHPASIVLIEIARRIALILGIEDDFMRFKDEKFLEMKVNEEIVYPSVLSALGLLNQENLNRKVLPGQMFFAGERLSIEEYIDKYIQYVLVD